MVRRRITRPPRPRVVARTQSGVADLYVRAALVVTLCALALLVLGCSKKGRAGSTRGPRLEDAQLATAQGPATEQVGEIEPVALFNGPMPTGVTVSRSGRIFVNFPRWGDQVEFTVAEVKSGQPAAYPDAAMNRYDPAKLSENLVSVQSVVVDPADRLWLLDTGSLAFGPVPPGAAKLVGVDLKTNRIFKTIHFPPDVALSTTYLNDIRFDLRRGTGGMAVITDSSGEGPNGIIVVDLDTGESWRRLHDHPSTKADPNFVPIVEGEPLMQRPVENVARAMTIGADGIAISGDGERLYYCPLSSHRFYSVSVDALADRSIPADQVAETVQEVPNRNFASDGLESDAAGRVYLTDYENNGVRVYDPRGGNTPTYDFVARDPRLIWPDTLSLAGDGYLYVTANQLNRQKQFHEGKDLRQQPYALFRVKVDAQPVRLVGRASPAGAAPVNSGGNP